MNLLGHSLVLDIRSKNCRPSHSFFVFEFYPQDGVEIFPNARY